MAAITVYDGSFSMLSKFITAAVVSLMSWSTAQACSFNPQTDYSVYSDKISAFLESDESYISIVKTSTLREYSEDFKSGRSDSKVRPFLELQVNLVETLFGPGSKDIKYTIKRAPEFSPDERAAEAKYAAKPRPFGFWDTFSVSNPKVHWYGSNPDTCGYRPMNTLDTDTFYIAIRRSWGGIAYEPITGLDDPLVQDFRDIIAGSAQSKIKRPAKDFFQNIDGYADIVISSCPVSVGGRHDTRDLRGEKAFRFSDHFNTPKALIAMQDLYQYRRVSEACYVGDRYLVVDSHYGNRRNRNIFPLLNPKARRRFLKVENGHIEASEIKSNIKITGKTYLPVDQVKAWIRDANSE